MPLWKKQGITAWRHPLGADRKLLQQREKTHMKPSENDANEFIFPINIKGLKIPEEKKASHEKEARQMAAKVDSLGYLDPLDEGLSLIFDPRA